ncbi:DoxX family protein [Flavimaricola marinus]|uniref:DoxX n=1 Tax=Flavimaricola marinus TaxID=1819565 RepID=A0A238L927_9RHOB|nr:DoxX family protein [Flavimaricola marinus]SMY05905.1 DoxX [Flavimaricola marinus]
MKYATWAAMAVVTLIMLMGGVMKLMGDPMATTSFGVLGLPAWFATFIGICEIAGGIGIWLRRTSMLAAIGIAIIMVGAIYYHVVHTPISEGIPAIVVLLCCGWIISRKGTGVIG